MKQEFKMEDIELLEMIDISRAEALPVMQVGGVNFGNEKQEAADKFWKRLAERYNFIWDSVEAAPNKGYNFFMAEPIPEPKTEDPTRIEMD